MNGNTADGIVRVRPFSTGPTFEIDTGGRPRVVMVTATSPYRDEDVRTVIFEDGPYRRGLTAASHDDVAALEIVGFATAYVERQDEFARDDDAPEQVHRATWQRYGDAIAAELSSMISGRDPS